MNQEPDQNKEQNPEILDSETKENKLIVQRRNIFNQMTGVEFTAHEFRFFLTTFALINPYNSFITDIYFPTETYKKLLNIKTLSEADLNKITNKLYNMSVALPTGPNGELENHHLFSACGTIYDNNIKQEVVHFKIDQGSTELFFNYNSNFSQFPIGGPFLLTRDTQFYLYTNLKEHQYKGEWTVSFEKLLVLLHLDKSNYKWPNFERRILKTYQENFKKNSDICFTYEPIKTGKSHSVTGVHFVILENENWVNPFDDDEIKNAIRIANKEAVLAGIKKMPKGIFDNKENKVLTAEEREDICAGTGDIKDFDIFENVHEFMLAVDYGKRLVETSKYHYYWEKHAQVLRDPVLISQYAVTDFLQNKLLEIELSNYRREKGVSKAEPIKDKVAYLLGILKSELNGESGSNAPKDSPKEQTSGSIYEYDDTEDEDLPFGVKE